MKPPSKVKRLFIITSNSTKESEKHMDSTPTIMIYTCFCFKKNCGWKLQNSSLKMHTCFGGIDTPPMIKIDKVLLSYFYLLFIIRPKSFFYIATLLYYQLSPSFRWYATFIFLLFLSLFVHCLARQSGQDNPL